jgi:hypothetical protein
MPMMNKLTASYVAGLLDGEGCIEIQKRNDNNSKNGYYYCPRIRVCMTNKEIIEWLKSFGGWTEKERVRDNRKTAYTWCISGAKLTKAFLDKVYPYLKVKKEEAGLVKKIINTFESSSYKIVSNELRNNGTGFHKELSEEMTIYRDEIYQKFRALRSCSVNDLLNRPLIGDEKV